MFSHRYKNYVLIQKELIFRCMNCWQGKEEVKQLRQIVVELVSLLTANIKDLKSSNTVVSNRMRSNAKIMVNKI